MYIEGAIIKIERTKQPNKSSTQPTERERGPVKAKRGTEKPEPRDYITKLREAITMKKQTMRKLEDSSWLAQTIKDKMEVEFDKNGPSPRWRTLQTFHTIVNEADDAENESIYYDNQDGKRQIIVSDIPSLMKHGTDFDREGMRCKLRGLAERYKDDDGMYIVSVLTTHDLNGATIKDVSELLYQMSH